MFTQARTVGQIKSEYRQLAKQYHPDLGGTHEKMKNVNAAYHAALLNANGQTRQDNGKTYTYNYNQEFEQAIMDKVAEILALNLDNLEVEIIGLWVWVSGSRKDQKDLLNKKNGIGLGWSGKRKMWHWKPYKGKARYNSKASTQDLRDMYGSRKFQNNTERAMATA